MEESLKPCPFCGGSAKMSVNMSNPKNPYEFITCNKCNISFGLYHSHDPDKIRVAWNKRAQDDTQKNK
jgi:Lar family restriction alleviation protein